MRSLSLLSMVALVNAVGSGCGSPTTGNDEAPSPGLRPPSLIVFSRDRSIYTIRPDGTQLHVIAQGRPARRSGNLSFRQPVWSPDGQHLAFVRTDGEDPGIETLVISRWDGSDARRFFPGEGTIFEIAWSPEGERLVFQRSSAQPRGLWLFSARRDGTGYHRIPSPNQIDPILQCPSWSPAGDNLAFVDQYKAVWKAGSDGNNPLRLFAGTVECVRWSPGGTRLAFVNNKNIESGGLDPRLEIYLINADGSGLTRLTDPPNNQFEPVWSPDGSSLAFAGSRDGTFGIFVSRQDGTAPVSLTSDLGIHWHMVWSPDGAQLAIINGYVQQLDIQLINADGTGGRNLTSSLGDELEVDWR
jgi:Tol biopolymer transport system component